MAATVLLLLIVLHLLVVAASAQRVALPGCRDITIPYPFGIGAGCYRDGQDGFQLECDDDSGRSPPRLTVVGYNHRLGGLSLAAGEARTYLNATRECYNSTGGLADRSRNKSYMSLDMASAYVFLVENEWFYTDRVFLNRIDDFIVPLVLDWAVRNVRNCSAASRNATDFACRSTLSECIDANNGAGYRCNCSAGYDGNPYLDDGCTDISECQLRASRTVR